MQQDEEVLILRHLAHLVLLHTEEVGSQPHRYRNVLQLLAHYGQSMHVDPQCLSLDQGVVLPQGRNGKTVGR